MRNNYSYKQIVNDVGKCELCGCRKDLQLHHIIPLVVENGVDLNVPENELVVCHICHEKLTPHSLLTKYGLQKARNEGTNLGRHKGDKLITKKSIEAKEIIRKRSKDFNGDLSDSEMIRLTGLARGTYYKYKRELKTDRMVIG